MTESIVDRAIAKAEELIGPSLADLDRLPAELQVIIRIVSAQGVIDNGGYRYFFGQDWPGQPDYAKFADAYEAIGCPEVAAELRRIVSTFPFPDPHRSRDARVKYMEANLDRDGAEIRGWGDALCGDEAVWSRLHEYCLRNWREWSP